MAGSASDNLIASAVLPALKKRYEFIHVFSQSPYDVIYQNNPYIDRLTTYNPGELPGDPVAWHEWHRLIGRQFDVFANLSHTCETYRAVLRGQTHYWWPDAGRRNMCRQSYIEAVADVFDLPYHECKPGFFPIEDEVARAQETRGEQIGPGPCIGWVISGTRVDKIYPAATLAIARLIKECEATVILFGGPGRDCEIGNRIIEHVKRQNGSIKGIVGAADPTPENQRWPIRRVLTQLQQCDLIISPDTGPMWSVGYLPIPKIVLLSHASPENITKYFMNCTTLHADQREVPCWPCHKLIDTERFAQDCRPDSTGQAASCISDISVEAIVYAAWTWLKSPWRAQEHFCGAFTSDALLSTRTDHVVQSETTAPLAEAAC